MDFLLEHLKDAWCYFALQLLCSPTGKDLTMIQVYYLVFLRVDI